MKIKHILESNEQDEYERDRAAKIARASKAIGSMYGAQRTSNHNMATKTKEIQAKAAQRAELVDKLIPIANKFTTSQFDEFAKAAEAVAPSEKLKDLKVSLAHIFDIHNRDSVELNRKSWDAYGKARQENDPSVVGIGPTGRRNWTGD